MNRHQVASRRRDGRPTGSASRRMGDGCGVETDGRQVWRREGRTMGADAENARQMGGPPVKRRC